MLRFATLFLLMIAVLLAAYHALSWKPVSPLPTALSGASGALVGEILYVARGSEEPGEQSAMNRALALDLATKATMAMLGVDIGPARLPNTSLGASQAKKLPTELEMLGFFEWLK